MKPILALFLLGVSIATPLRAQAPAAITYAPGSLDQLVAPIALYPDTLVALILSASTAPTDVVLAARFVENNGDPAQAEAQPWDPSVQALVHYPDLITWMDANLAWTQTLGQAFALQPEAVMQSVQTMRARARAAGNLQSTPQQQVVLAGNVIEIVPVESSVIYLPCYDSTVVYETGPGWGYPLVTFRLAFPVGPWLHFACDWSEHRIRPEPWRRSWDDRRDGRAPAASHFSPPPAARGHSSPPRADTRLGQWRPTPPSVTGPAPARPRGTTIAPPPNRGNRPPAPVVNDQRSGSRRPAVRATPPAPPPNRGPSASAGRTEVTRNFSGRGPGNRPAIGPASRPPISNAAPRREVVRATPPAPPPNRGPSAGAGRTEVTRNFNGRGPGNRPAIGPASRPSIPNAAPRGPAPRTERAEGPRRGIDVASR